MINLSRFASLCIASALCCSSLIHAQNNSEWHPIGTGSEEMPYEISSDFDLWQYAQRIKTEENFTVGKFFVLTNDIAIQDVNIIDEYGNIIADTCKLTKWEPIGTQWYGKAFAGTFDGQGHTISGLYVTNPSLANEYSGLFGYLSGTVKNLTITNSLFCGVNNIGAVAGYMYSDKASIENCVSYATILGQGGPTMTIGGIFGYTIYGTITNCTNYGKITLNPSPDQSGYMWNCTAGGIGGSGGNIYDSQNYGHITALNWGGLGGICGSPRYINRSKNYGTIEDFHGNAIGGIGSRAGSIYNSENHAPVISHAEGAYIGGICGRIDDGGRISNCTNYHNLSTEQPNSFVGGICGYGNIDSYTTTYLTGCSNLGSISSEASATLCAGIVPFLYHVEVKKSKNYGNISCISNAGGIVATAKAHSTISNAENHGSISGASNVGGIVGESVEGVRGSLNTGDVVALTSANTGGIAGNLTSSSSSVIDCANIGNVTNTSGGRIGGIAGSHTSRGTIHNSYNSGNVTSFGTSYIGGIAGSFAGSILNCYNKGNVINYGNKSNVAGIVAWNDYNVVNVFSTGLIYCYGENEIVGDMISGSYSSYNGYAQKTNLYYTKSIVGNPAKFSEISNVYTFNKISDDELNSLTEIFNATKESYESDYWQPGYYHPLLNRFYANPGSEYDDPEFNFAVNDMSNTPCRIDLGLPFDNKFFITEADDDLSTLCANTISNNNTVNRLLIIGHKDFIVPDSELNIKKASINFVNLSSITAKVLPWDINCENLPEGIKAYSFVNADDGMTAQFALTDEICAGKAVIFEIPDSIKTLTISADNFSLTLLTPESGIFEGSFTQKEITNGLYLLNPADSTFKKALLTNEINAFDAYLNLPDCDAESLALNLSNQAVGITAPTDCQNTAIYINAAQLKVSISGLTTGSIINVYDITGKNIASKQAQGCETSISLPAAGIYIITTPNKAFKITI